MSEFAKEKEENSSLHEINQRIFSIISLLYDKYVDTKELDDIEKTEGPPDIEKMLCSIEEKLKQANSAFQAEINMKIIQKFDQLRDYYRVQKFFT